MLRILDRERGSNDIWVFVKQGVIRIVSLADEINRVQFESSGVLCRKRAVILQANEQCVSMIRCKIELGEEVCPENAASYVGDYEFKIESLLANFDGNERSTETLDVGTISCFEFRANGTF